MTKSGRQRTRSTRACFGLSLARQKPIRSRYESTACLWVVLSQVCFLAAILGGSVHEHGREMVCFGKGKSDARQERDCREASCTGESRAHMFAGRPHPAEKSRRSSRKVTVHTGRKGLLRLIVASSFVKNWGGINRDSSRLEGSQQVAAFFRHGVREGKVYPSRLVAGCGPLRDVLSSLAATPHRISRFPHVRL